MQHFSLTMCFDIVQGNKAMRIAVAKGNVNLVKALLDTTKSLSEQLQAKLSRNCDIRCDRATDT